jgi:hypothetical protein
MRHIGIVPETAESIVAINKVNVDAIERLIDRLAPIPEGEEINYRVFWAFIQALASGSYRMTIKHDTEVTVSSSDVLRVYD